MSESLTGYEGQVYIEKFVKKHKKQLVKQGLLERFYNQSDEDKIKRIKQYYKHRRESRIMSGAVILGMLFLSLVSYNYCRNDKIKEQRAKQYEARFASLYQECLSTIDKDKDGTDLKDWGIAYTVAGKQFDQFSSNPKCDLDTSDLKRIIDKCDE